MYILMAISDVLCVHFRHNKYFDKHFIDITYASFNMIYIFIFNIDLSDILIRKASTEI